MRLRYTYYQKMNFRKLNRMKIKQLFATSFLVLLCTMKGLAQENNCDVRQLQVSTYEFVLKNLDSIKKHTPKELITASLEFSEKGELKKTTYYTGYDSAEKKEVKLWKGLEDHIRSSFSLCPDSHFYNNREQVLGTVFKIPLVKENVTKAIKEVETGVNYIKAGTGQTDIPKNSQYTFNLKKIRVGDKVVENFKKEGQLEHFRSKLFKLNDNFHFAFEVIKVPGTKTNYIHYKLFEAVNYKGVMVTSEGWRPIVNGKLNLSVTGKRDMHEGVKDVNFEETFDIEVDITFK